MPGNICVRQKFKSSIHGKTAHGNVQFYDGHMVAPRMLGGIESNTSSLFPPLLISVHILDVVSLVLC